MEIDPVCHNSFGVDKAMFQSTYKGDVFYFDSRECKEMFDTDPRKYAAEKAGKGPSEQTDARRKRRGS